MNLQQFAILIILALGIHTVFDFAFQTRNMAINKSKTFKALFEHVAIYSVGVAIIGAIMSKWVGIGWWEHSLFVTVNVVLHGATDFVTSRASSYAYHNEDMHSFWVIIGIDQLVHASTLVATICYLIS